MMVAMRFPWLVLLLLAGCAGDPSGPADDSTDAGPHGYSEAQSAPAGSEPGGTQPSAFDPVTVTWDGTTFVGACAFQGGTGTCAGSPLADYANTFEVPVGASNATITISWDDPADRQLNVRLDGAVDEPMFGLGASPLSMAAPLNGTELQVSVSQYVANEAGIQAHSEISFHAEITFS